MRGALISLLLACGAACAEVIECPPAYPLASTPLASDSKAFASRSLLFGGGVFIGELGGIGELRGDDRTVKGGFDVRFGFGQNEPRWFVCNYGRDGAISSWRTIDVKATSCMMRQRTLAGVTTVKAECK
jgi:hypothetical protein